MIRKSRFKAGIDGVIDGVVFKIRLIALPLLLAFILPANPLHWLRHHPRTTELVVAAAIAGAVVAGQSHGAVVRLKHGCAECSGVGR